VHKLIERAETPEIKDYIYQAVSAAFVFFTATKNDSPNWRPLDGRLAKSGWFFRHIFLGLLLGKGYRPEDDPPEAAKGPRGRWERFKAKVGPGWADAKLRVFGPAWLPRTMFPALQLLPLVTVGAAIYLQVIALEGTSWLRPEMTLVEDLKQAHVLGEATMRIRVAEVIGFLVLVLLRGCLRWSLATNMLLAEIDRSLSPRKSRPQTASAPPEIA
jgi:hypothetical protein